MTPEEVELLSELTIVIPTYNRPFELERVIEYWRDLPVTVHILDGSKSPWFPVGRLPDTLKITYHHLPQLNEEDLKDNYIRRIKFGSELSTSNFAALCSDDDLFTVNGLLVALRALNDDVCDVVLGKQAQYLFRDGKFEWKRVCFSFLSDHDTLSHNLMTRLRSNHGGATYYGIFGSHYWKELRLSSVEEKFLTSTAIENIFHILSKTLCRLLVIQEYLCVTNYPDKKYRNAPHKVEKFSAWLNSDKNHEEVEKFLQVLKNGLKKFIEPKNQIEIDEIANEILTRHKNTPPKLRLIVRARVFINKKLLFYISKMPLKLRIKIFYLLPIRWKKVLRTADFVDSRAPIMEIDSDDLGLRKTVVVWESIMSKPREELRLRANL